MTLWNWKVAYTCDDLGACQSRQPACRNCKANKADKANIDLPTPTLPIHQFPFAPGVIDHSPKPSHPALTKWLVRWVWLTVAIAAICFAAGLLP